MRLWVFDHPAPPFHAPPDSGMHDAEYIGSTRGVEYGILPSGEMATVHIHVFHIEVAGAQAFVAEAWGAHPTPHPTPTLPAVWASGDTADLAIARALIAVREIADNRKASARLAPDERWH